MEKLYNVARVHHFWYERYQWKGSLGKSSLEEPLHDYTQAAVSYKSYESYKPCKSYKYNGVVTRTKKNICVPVCYNYMYRRLCLNVSG